MTVADSFSHAALPRLASGSLLGVFFELEKTCGSIFANEYVKTTLALNRIVLSFEMFSVDHYFDVQ